jgi:hypothetical protein
MKKYFLFIALLCGLLLSSMTFAEAKVKKTDDEAQRISQIVEPNPFVFNTSFPRGSNAADLRPLSTGYYFVDSDDDVPDYWRPNVEYVDTTEEPNMWRRIIPGPRVRDPQYWEDHPEEGLRFFRNPAYPSDTYDFFEGATDSTDDAIAGPIPIGFNFYFNGLRFDSFYVSTNGIIALSNRRYYYNSAGDRAVPPGANNCYDPMSMDWYASGRAHNTPNGTGLDDPAGDDYGYRYAVCGGNPTGSPTGGIRARGGNLSQWGDGNKLAVIAPFFGDMHLSQFNPFRNLPEDHGRVYFKRYNSADRLLIYFVNVAPIRGKGTPYGNYTAPQDYRPGDQNYIAADAQVLMDKRDSSITITYLNFEGVAVVGGRGVSSKVVFRYNSTVGVRGFARHVNYSGPGTGTYPWAGEYQQFTHYFSNYANPQFQYPFPWLAIKFKQWKNTLRVHEIQYLVRKKDANADLGFYDVVKDNDINDYELLAGEERIGAVQPVAVLQNLTNEIQGPAGVNFQPQELNFRARFRIVNMAAYRIDENTMLKQPFEKIVYNRLVPIDSTCLALPPERAADCTGDPDTKVRYITYDDDDIVEMDFPGDNGLNGIPPYGYVKVNFPPFEPNEYVTDQIGRFNAYIIADPTDPSSNEGLRDEWPFDDTTAVRLFVMKRLESFSDDVTEYHMVQRVPMPSVLKWVNIEAEVANGEDVSRHAMPPRGEYRAYNSDFSVYESPVIRMTRKTLAGGEPTSPRKGDEIRSFPIDMRDKYGSVLSLAVQRTIDQDDWTRDWGDNRLVGPEPRCVINSNPLRPWDRMAYSASYSPDWLAVEFAAPSKDGLNDITNIKEKNWQIHPTRGGGDPVEGMSAYVIYGAGGVLRGFLEDDKDSSLSKPTANARNGLRADIFDDGVDFEYKKIFIAIPDTFINAPAEGAKNFRFRVRVNADNDQKCPFCIPDDDDPFFVDNVKILFQEEITDIEATSVKIIWPYTEVPASQATKVPVRAILSNNTSIGAPAFTLQVKITPRGGQRPVYCRNYPISNMQPRSVEEIRMPTWNARNAGPGQYRMQAIVYIEGGDLEPLNDTTFFDFEIKFGETFAYDPVEGNPRNDVPDDIFTGVPGRGLNMYGFSMGAQGNVGQATSAYNENEFGAGYVGGSGSGQIAARFTLFQADTIYGYSAYFAPLNSAPDYIAFAVYTDQNQPSNTVVPGTLMLRQRGLGEDMTFPEYSTYLNYMLPEPVVLPAGTYWVAISQMGETGFELGASKSRVGMRTTSIYIPPPYDNQTGTAGTWVGGSGVHLCIEKNFRKDMFGNLINDNFFCYENTRGSREWQQFMPTNGNPAYAHLHHYGISPVDGATATLARGTWVPMIRPYMGERSYADSPEYQDCPEIPVELVYFDGQVRKNGIDLFWETASELNNAGFNVERKVYGDKDSEWKAITFVEGNGTTQQRSYYSFNDQNVEMNTTYQYRLRQIDMDGTQGCELSQIVTLRYSYEGDVVLEENSPNPFSTSTWLRFTLPYAENVRFEILDIYGNVVRTLANDMLSATSHDFEWDGSDNYGNKVSQGTYIYRLIVGDEVKTGKMTLLR